MVDSVFVLTVELEEVVSLVPVVDVEVKLNRRTDDVVLTFDEDDLTRVVKVADEEDVVHAVRDVDSVVVFFTEEDAVSVVLVSTFLVSVRT